MPATAAIYQRYGDNAVRSATITIQTGTAPTGQDLIDYGPASLVDDNPAKVAKINSVTGAWVFDFGVAQRLDLFALIHHDFDPGGDVKLQGNATNTWGSPSFSASFVIPAWDGASSGARRWPVNPWMDVTEQAGYSAAGFRYWRLVITGNSQNLQLGEVWGSPTIRRLDPDLQWNFQRSVLKRQIQNRTAFGVATTYTRGTSEWRIRGDHLFDAALRADLQTHWIEVEGAARPWLFVPEGLENRCYLVRWLETMREEQQQMDALVGSGEVHTNQFAVEEVSRGLRPGV
jgi:hypothetical protein